MNFLLTIVIGLVVLAIIVSVLLTLDSFMIHLKNPKYYRIYNRLLGVVLMMFIVPMAFGVGKLFLQLTGE
jgi:threonine/homoserine/homoserine lactone efflux protein